MDIAHLADGAVGRVPACLVHGPRVDTVWHLQIGHGARQTKTAKASTWGHVHPPQQAVGCAEHGRTKIPNELTFTFHSASFSSTRGHVHTSHHAKTPQLLICEICEAGCSQTWSDVVKHGLTRLDVFGCNRMWSDAIRCISLRSDYLPPFPLFRPLGTLHSLTQPLVGGGSGYNSQLGL